MSFNVLPTINIPALGEHAKPTTASNSGKRLFCALVFCLSSLSCADTSDASASAQSAAEVSPAAQPATAAPAPQFAAPIPSHISVQNGDTIEYAAVHVTKPRATLVFENGLMLELTTWQSVAHELADCCDLLFYNRPGVGRSETDQDQVTPQQSAARLQHLLQSQQMSPPYILVGHSLGGQYAQVFAYHYPQQVAGIVLVDALPLGVMKPADKFPWYTRAGLWLGASSAIRAEIASSDSMSRLLLANPGYFHKPMVRLVAQTATPQSKSAGLLKNLWNGVIYAEDFGVWAQDPDEAERRMAGIYPQAEVRTLVANHRMQEQYPSTVVAAIFSVINQQQPTANNLSNNATSNSASRK